MSCRGFCGAVILAAVLITSPGGVLAQTATGSAPAAGKFTPAQFRGLRFLEGAWKGSGYAPGPFYETYRFLNDSTFEMTAWADSTLTRQKERAIYVFRGGEIRKEDRSAAVTHIDSLGYHFSTLSGRTYRWTFRRITADRWTATLGPTTVYTMDRIKR
jgi:hypothetical protein